MLSINSVFDNFYYRLIIACALSLLITFVDDFDVFHKKTMTILLLILVIMMALTTLAEDYGLFLLIVALFFLSYNMSYIKVRRNTNKVIASE